MEEIKFHITGTAPLMMHNVRLVDPLDPHTKALASLTSNRKKTEDIHLQIQRCEFEGGLYHDDDLGPYIKGETVEKVLREGGTGFKLGKATVEAAVAGADRFALEYDGPRDIEGLYAKGFWDRRAIGVASSKTIRTRPCFAWWGLSFNILYDEERFNRAQIVQCIEYAGRFKGIGDHRPRFGRFEVENGN